MQLDCRVLENSIAAASAQGHLRWGDHMNYPNRPPSSFSRQALIALKLCTCLHLPALTHLPCTASPTRHLPAPTRSWLLHLLTPIRPCRHVSERRQNSAAAATLRHHRRLWGRQIWYQAPPTCTYPPMPATHYASEQHLERSWVINQHFVFVLIVLFNIIIIFLFMFIFVFTFVFTIIHFESMFIFIFIFMYFFMCLFKCMFMS